VNLQWHRFSKYSMLRGVIQLFSFVVAMIAIVVKQFFEDDSLDDMRHIMMRLGVVVLWWILAGLAVASVITTIAAAINWRCTAFALAGDGIHLRSGVLIKKHRQLKWDRIQSVDVTQGVVARIFKQGTLAIDSAGGSSEKMSLGLLSLAECNALRGSMMEISAAARAGQPVIVPDWQERALLEGASWGVAAEAGEKAVYRLGTARMIAARIASASTAWGLVSLIVAIVLTVTAASGAIAIPLFFIVAGALWGAIKDLARWWGTRVFLAPNGLRVRSGLVTTFAQTIPPGRVHAIEVFQPVLWRRFGWWKLRVMIASSDLSDAKGTPESDSVVIPVGTRADVERMMWVLIPDLGVKSPSAFLEESFGGAGQTEHFRPAPRASRFFDPFGWRRNAIALTATVAVLRWGGFWRRSVRVVWHEHFQSLQLTQGPLQRCLGLASMSLCMVGSAITVRQQNMDECEIRELMWDECSRGRIRRAEAESESLEAWRGRVLPFLEEAPWKEEDCGIATPASE
jgi:putative membrane protein